ncbi:uncharacterized protein C2orf42 homolog [Leptinotarsa decemlineata]|uniref:uncharacterized protein C2orf42 homolog n=1 Tax=Leptinotarsa decemlineata TaxID=7539 RepID=UPI003D309826
MYSNSRKRVCLPRSSLTNVFNFSQKLLPGIGKSTKRGIKKCWKCGVYNGTRSTMCKNKKCGVILKDSEEKLKVDLDAVKLITGAEKQLFSVRVRDMGPDYRGFVQLPIFQLNSEGSSNVCSEVALCFVDSCQNSFHNSILRCHEEDQNATNLICAHIKSALESQSTASPTELKDDVLHALKAGNDVKEKLYLLASEKEGCLVQRVSKSIMAVKCQVSPKHPLGYLHFTFFRGKGRDIYEKYFCSCVDFKGSEPVSDKYGNDGHKCIHYYACIWALGSDPKHYGDFSYFRRCEFSNTESNSVSELSEVPVSYELTKSKPSLQKVPEVKLKSKNPKKKSEALKSNEFTRKCQRIMPKVIPVEIKILSDLPICNDADSWRFMDWLSYVTECVNQTMKFENCGLLNTLGFQIPENFFQCFMKRIPKVYNVSLIGDSLIYNVMNILHLKEIFDTPQVKLKISKKFVHIEGEGYLEYKDQDETELQNGASQCKFIFFFNVGQSTVDESDNTNNSFYIEWTPSLMNFTNIGHLKFQYKYGRKST